MELDDTRQCRRPSLLVGGNRADMMTHCRTVYVKSFGWVAYLNSRAATRENGQEIGRIYKDEYRDGGVRYVMTGQTRRARVRRPPGAKSTHPEAVRLSISQ